MSDKIAASRLQFGEKYPYDEQTPEPIDWAHKTARGILADLEDRRGIRQIFEKIQNSGDHAVCTEIVQGLAAIIREGEAAYHHDGGLMNAPENPTLNPLTDAAVDAALSNLTFDTDAANKDDSKDFSFTQVVFAGDEALYGIGERTSGEAFQIDVLDEAKKNGSVTLEIGSTESNVDDYVSLTTTVATLPGTRLLRPRFHVEGTISGVELDIFQSKSGFLLRLPEEQELITVVTEDGEVLYSIGKKSK